MEKSEVKVLGVALDNYKVKYFNQELIKKGYEVEDATIKFNEGVQIIQINCPKEKVLELGKLIESLEATFKRRN